MKYIFLELGVVSCFSIKSFAQEEWMDSTRKATGGKTISNGELEQLRKREADRADRARARRRRKSMRDREYREYR